MIIGYFIAFTILLGFIRFYQMFLRPFGLASCVMQPSCSEYALGALYKHGPFYGLFLSVKRIISCNPFNKNLIDPVP